jgi:putative hydrolase of the HAD superfamily
VLDPPYSVTVAGIRAILFDADGVLQYSRADDLPALLERTLGFVPAPVEAFVNEVIELERPALAGQTDFAEELEPLVARWGAPGKGAVLAAGWACCIDTDASVLELIGKLRRQGLLCALATNQQRYRAKCMRETLGYDTVFELSFYSHQLGFAKPDVRYFSAVVAGLPVPPEATLFIDDLEKNVFAARQVGFHAEQFVHPRNTDAVLQLKALLARFAVNVTD